MSEASWLYGSLDSVDLVKIMKDSSLIRPRANLITIKMIIRGIGNEGRYLRMS